MASGSHWTINHHYRLRPVQSILTFFFTDFWLWHRWTSCGRRAAVCLTASEVSLTVTEKINPGVFFSFVLVPNVFLPSHPRQVWGFPSTHSLTSDSITSVPATNWPRPRAGRKLPVHPSLVSLILFWTSTLRSILNQGKSGALSPPVPSNATTNQCTSICKLHVSSRLAVPLSTSWRSWKPIASLQKLPHLETCCLSVVAAPSVLREKGMCSLCAPSAPIVLHQYGVHLPPPKHTQHPSETHMIMFHDFWRKVWKRVRYHNAPAILPTFIASFTGDCSSIFRKQYQLLNYSALPKPPSHSSIPSQLRCFSCLSMRTASVHVWSDFICGGRKSNSWDHLVVLCSHLALSRQTRPLLPSVMSCLQCLPSCFWASSCFFSAFSTFRSWGRRLRKREQRTRHLPLCQNFLSCTCWSLLCLSMNLLQLIFQTWSRRLHFIRQFASFFLPTAPACAASLPGTSPCVLIFYISTRPQRMI